LIDIFNGFIRKKVNGMSGMLISLIAIDDIIFMNRGSVLNLNNYISRLA